MNQQNTDAAVLLAKIAMRPVLYPEANRAFNDFWRLYHRRILNICISQCEKLHAQRFDIDPEELFQDVMLKLIDVAGQFDPAKANAFTWLTTMIFNQIVSEIRKRKDGIQFVSLSIIEEERSIVRGQLRSQGVTRHDSLDNAFVGTEVVSEECRADGKREKEKKELRTQLRNALGSLPESWRDILLTTAQYKPGEIPPFERERICNTHNIADGSIKTYRMRAKLKLEQTLGFAVDWTVFLPVAQNDESFYA